MAGFLLFLVIAMGCLVGLSYQPPSLLARLMLAFWAVLATIVAANMSAQQHADEVDRKAGR